MKDFSSLVLLLREFHGVTANIANNDTEEEEDGGQQEMEPISVEIKTGDMATAGTDADVYMTLIGEPVMNGTLPARERRDQLPLPSLSNH